MVSQKGGAGKSTLARLLAVEGAGRDWRAKIADLDLLQGTSMNWNMRRQRAGRTPAIDVQTFGAVDHALRDSATFDLVLIDGAPHASTQTAQAAKAAELVIIPTKPTLDDLTAALGLARELVGKNATEPRRILFVLNQTTDSSTEAAEAREWLLKGGFPVAEAHIPLKTGYSRALDAGDALSEAKHPSLQGRARVVANEIFEYLQVLQKEG
ncbi:MAG: ParA family protein [Steroidobacteraceae bacterium]